tara:strand:+ start:878 stop:1111 length:234 start_codon:yes stop_codon:yes gene_type:complete
MVIKLTILIFISLFFTVSSAYAYLDPGTGSIIIQAILGALAAGLVFIKIYWHKLLVLLRIRKDMDVNQKQDSDNKNN